jgi:hypothetical protein
MLLRGLRKIGTAPGGFRRGSTLYSSPFVALALREKGDVSASEYRTPFKPAAWQLVSNSD